MVKFKGKFCKKGKIKIIQALKEGRDNRWENKDDISADKSVPISHDHGYATCSTINSDPSETVSRGVEICSVTDSLEEEEWRTGRRIVELGKDFSYIFVNAKKNPPKTKRKSKRSGDSQLIVVFVSCFHPLITSVLDPLFII